MQGLCIRIRIRRDRFYSHTVRSADNASRNFATVGDEQFFNDRHLMMDFLCLLGWLLRYPHDLGQNTQHHLIRTTANRAQPPIAEHA